MKRLLIITWGLLALAACGVSMEPNYYTLNPTPGDITLEESGGIKINRPVLPGYLDRPDIVQQSDDHIYIDEMNRWAEPLDVLLERIMAMDLRQRMPHEVIVTELDDKPPRACFLLENNVDQFNQIDTHLYRMSVQVTVKDSCGCNPWATTSFTSTTEEQSGSKGLSILIGQLADRVSALVYQADQQRRLCSSSQTIK